MAQSLEEIAWDEPIVSIVDDPEWKAEVLSIFGSTPDFLLRVAPIRWLRDTCFKWERLPVKEIPTRLVDIGILVTAHENACRYCYGAAKAHMKFYGYSDKMISNIEREMQLAEMDEKDRVFIQFCRSLSRSKPRPAKSDREELVELGFSPTAIAEMAFLITNHCFYNRVCTFIACNPEVEFEKFAGSFLGRIMRPFVAKKLRNLAPTDVQPLSKEPLYFAPIVNALGDLPAASMLNETLEGAFASPILSFELKMLMFGVVARSLDCGGCQEESKQHLIEKGFSESEFDTALSALNSSKLNEQESKILAWTRETVHFQTNVIQKHTRALAAEVPEDALLEAIGVASLANTTVRLAMLLG